MGYRSSIYIQIPIKQWGVFVEAIRAEAEEPAEGEEFAIEILSFLEGLRVEHITETNVFFSDYIKWYDSDPIIRILDDTVKGTDGCVFIRTGEDAEDIEWYDSAEEKTYFMSCGHITCEGTTDALEMGLDMLRGIEAAPSDVRLEAITKLRKYLTALEEAEGITPLPESTDFEG